MPNSQHDLLFRIVIFVPTELSLVNFSTFKRILNHGFKTNGLNRHLFILQSGPINNFVFSNANFEV